MYTYIYDSFVSQKKYLSILNQLETRLTDLGVGGRICRLSKLRSLRDIVKQELRRNPKTLIAVGGDWLVHQIIGLMLEFKVPLGIVPLGAAEDNLIASGLGIDLKEAPQTLSARRLVNLDLGLVNNRWFLRCASFNADNVKIDIENNYSIRVGKARVEIINFLPAPMTDDYSGQRPNPEDGRLNLKIIRKEKGLFKKAASQTTLNFGKIKIEGSYSGVLLDNVTGVSGLNEISILKNALPVIVGKERNF